MKDLFDIVKLANQHPHHGDPIKMKVYDILREKYTKSFEKEIKRSIQFDYLGMARAKTKWHEYLKSFGMTFDKKDGILDPSWDAVLLEVDRRGLLAGIHDQTPVALDIVAEDGTSHTEPEDAGILDPSCHLEWKQRYIKIPEDMMDKILTLGLP